MRGAEVVVGMCVSLGQALVLLKMGARTGLVHIYSQLGLSGLVGRWLVRMLGLG